RRKHPKGSFHRFILTLRDSSIPFSSQEQRLAEYEACTQVSHGKDMGVHRFARMLDNFQETWLDEQGRQCISTAAKKMKFLQGIPNHIYVGIRPHVDLDSPWKKITKMAKRMEFSKGRGIHNTIMQPFKRKSPETLRR